MRSRFIDRLLVFVKGGAGGNGLPKYMGVGGKGGDVIVCSTKDQTMRKLIKSNPSKRFLATVGDHSRKFVVQASAGIDCIIHVPPGVQVITKQGQLLGDCNVDGDCVTAARGGAGGHKDNAFVGQPGEARHLFLVHKMIADVGLVGFPNAGKSTLLRAVSAARPKVARYPFTTMEPKVGMVEYEDGRSISMTDLPGLIEGASKNIGLGHSFLRHIERTKLMLFVVDLFGFRLKNEDPLRSALETIAILNKEIELYKPELLDKPAVLVANKMDLPGADQHWSRLQAALRNVTRGAMDVSSEHSQLCSLVPEHMRPRRWVQFERVLAISARSAGVHDCGDGVTELRRCVRTTLDRLQLEQDQQSGASPDLSVFRERVQAGAYVPLRGRVVEMHSGVHRGRSRHKEHRPPPLPVLV